MTPAALKQCYIYSWLQKIHLVIGEKTIKTKKGQGYQKYVGSVQIRLDGVLLTEEMCSVMTPEQKPAR